MAPVEGIRRGLLRLLLLRGGGEDPIPPQRGHHSAYFRLLSACGEGSGEGALRDSIPEVMGRSLGKKGGEGGCLRPIAAIILHLLPPALRLRRRRSGSNGPPVAPNAERWRAP